MAFTQEKFRIDIDKLGEQQVSVLRALYREGERHMKYYHSTMGAFRYPEKRVKCFDTKYFEDVMPEIKKILDQLNQFKDRI